MKRNKLKLNDTIQEREDYEKSLIDEFEYNIVSAAEAELEYLLSVSRPKTTPIEGLLTKKLRLTNGKFPVTPDSEYNDFEWKLESRKFGYNKSIFFKGRAKCFDNVKRALTFYCLPENAITHRIKSSSSSLQFSNDINVVEEYLFIKNHLPATPEGLALISSRMVNDLLDEMRDAGRVQHYISFARIMNLWIALSTQNHIPDEFKIHLTHECIDVPERRTEIQTILQATLQPWVSFSEDDLLSIMDYSHYWVDKVLPQLQRLKPAVESYISRYPRGKAALGKRNFALEDSMRLVVEGKEISLLRCRQSFRADRGTRVWHYSIKAAYANLLDKIRNGVLMLIALVTGARPSELAPLSITDISKKGENYWIRIVRWKTSNAPNYDGEVEFLPLPKYVAEAAINYDTLKLAANRVTRHWLFPSNAKSIPMQEFTPQILTSIINQLRDALPIERFHLHRFRKTIAEILINRDERNIDIIRALFGHKNYAMTLRYIARNPAMVRCVAAVIEENFTEELHEIVLAIQYGSYSGEAASRIAKQIKSKPDAFTKRSLQISLLDYVSHLITTGEPLFIKRVAVGTFCLTAENFTLETLPPCLHGRVKNLQPGSPLMPDPQHCSLECRKIVVLEKAKQSLRDNIVFFERVLAQADSIHPANLVEIQKKIQWNRFHIEKLRQNDDSIIVRAQHE
jgi:integrase